jgi:U3 small nucleolar RNA-associated protein 13
LQFKLINTEQFDCEIVSGHKEVVFCVNSNHDGQYLITGSKDKSGRIWKVNVGGDGRPKVHSLAQLIGHSEAIGTVAFSRKSNAFAISGSKDRTIKIWPLPEDVYDCNESIGSPLKFVRASLTIKAHEKDINSISVSPNDRMIASASQDKTAKLWSVETGELLGECVGHKRGVWRCVFSPVDQVLATCSGDKTVKLWNLRDFSCLRTFEGHTHSVLNVAFLSFGAQLLSAGGDGLVKLWTIRTNECVATLDAHEDRIWALATSKSEDVFVSGSADSFVQVWRDSTKEDQESRLAEEAVLISKYVAMCNFVVANFF